jgi:hypothetical protein
MQLQLLLISTLDGVKYQFLSPAALSPGKEPPEVIKQEAGWAVELVLVSY